MTAHCVSPVCDKKVFARDMCAGHYSRWYRYGDARLYAPIASRSTPTHGYLSYTYGCRCEVCTTAKRDYTRELRAERRSFRHGSRSGYDNHGCRCDACRAVKLAAHRDYYARTVGAS